MIKKLLGVLVLIVLAGGLGYWIWSRDSDPLGSSRAASDNEASHIPTGTICVVQYVSHPLLDAVYTGFQQELGRQGFPPSQLQFDNANGDATAASLLADKVAQPGCALVFALATPMAQGVKNKLPVTRPILFGAITDPMSAQLVSSMERPGANVTGTSDQWPYDLQMQLIAKVWGASAAVGVPFNPAEANTQYAMEQIRKSASRIGLSLREVPINSVMEASQAIDALANSVRVIYVPADNTAVAAAPGIVAAADRANVPVVAGDPGTFRAGAVVGIGVDYSNLGVLNAKQALAILRGASPADMPVEISNRPELYIDAARASRFQVDPAMIRSWYASIVR